MSNNNGCPCTIGELITNELFDGGYLDSCPRMRKDRVCFAGEVLVDEDSPELCGLPYINFLPVGGFTDQRYARCKTRLEQRVRVRVNSCNKSDYADFAKALGDWMKKQSCKYCLRVGEVSQIHWDGLTGPVWSQQSRQYFSEGFIAFKLHL